MTSNSIRRCVVGFAIVTLLFANGAMAAEPGWLSSLQTAQQKSAESGKPIFAVFRCER